MGVDVCSAKRKKRTDTRTDISPSESYIYQIEWIVSDLKFLELGPTIDVDLLKSKIVTRSISTMSSM